MSKTIIALDFSSEKEVFDFLDKFKEPVFVKVGMELLYGCGLGIIRSIKKRGHQIFLDLKLHDIPNTVRAAMRNLASLDVDMVNVHAAGGTAMMRAAVLGLEEGKAGEKRPLLIAVTMLTSTSKDMMNNELNISGSVEDTVISYARNAYEAGLDGVVCSVNEAGLVHKEVSKEFLTVTPGIRLEDDSLDDQKRVATPNTARLNGSDFIVVGRSITRSSDPETVYSRIEEIMSSGDDL